MKRCYEWSDGMAKQIEGVYERVLECAKKEFLTKGFLEASLRDIAKEVQVRFIHDLGIRKGYFVH